MSATNHGNRALKLMFNRIRICMLRNNIVVNVEEV